MTDINNNIRKAITDLRQKYNLTQDEFGKIFSVSGKTVSNWENGSRQISAATLNDIMQHYKVSLGDFVSSHSEKYALYTCNFCGNTILSTKFSGVACCGKGISPITADCIEDITYSSEVKDNVISIRINHEMSYNHYITSISYIAGNTCTSIALSPFDTPEVNFIHHGKGTLYITCLKHGTKKIEIK